MKRVMLGAALAGLLLAGGGTSARADVLHASAHVIVGAQLPGGTSYHDLSDAEPLVATASYAEPNYPISAFAQAEPDPTRLVQATVVGTYNVFGGQIVRSSSQATARWNDSVHVSGPNPPPAYLRLYFHFAGSIPPVVTRTPGQADGEYQVNLEMGNGSTPESGLEINFHNGGPGIGLSRGIDHLEITSDSLDVSFHFDAIPFPVGTAGFFFFDSLGLQYEPPYGVIGNSFFTDPLTSVLTNVVLPDGNTPESEGYTLIFDSGMPSPNRVPGSVVPELSSWLLFGTGVSALFGYSLRRRHGR